MTDASSEDPNGLSGLEGVIGTRDARDLADYAGRLAEIGRASHSPLGERIVAYAERLCEIAVEVKRRLAEVDKRVEARDHRGADAGVLGHDFELPRHRRDNDPRGPRPLPVLEDEESEA